MLRYSLWILIFIILNYTNALAADAYNFSFKLSSQKANGDFWDLFEGPPDPVLCIVPQRGPNKNITTCFVSTGNGNAEERSAKAGAFGKTAAKSRVLPSRHLGAKAAYNSFYYAVEERVILDTDFLIYLFDQDTRKSDLAGRVHYKNGNCSYLEMGGVSRFRISSLAMGELCEYPSEHMEDSFSVENGFLETMIKFSSRGYFKYVDWNSVESCLNNNEGTIKQCFAHQLIALTGRHDLRAYNICEKKSFELLKKYNFGETDEQAIRFMKNLLKNKKAILNGLGGREVFATLDAYYGEKLDDNLSNYRAKNVDTPSIPIRNKLGALATIMLNDATSGCR